MSKTYGPTSRENRVGVHPDLLRLMDRVLESWDHSISDGIRSIAEQQRNIAKGVSRTMDSKHLPRDEAGKLDPNGKAWAMDVLPYPFDGWRPVQKLLDLARIHDPGFQTFEFYMFLGFVAGTASEMGIPVRLGADWDGDREFSEHSFIDLPHIEMKSPTGA